jgi:nucleoside-diphosphate-sugar epimerase
VAAALPAPGMMGAVRTFIVGGTGLIGSRIAGVLRERGHAVTTAARSPDSGADHRLDLESASAATLRPLLAGHDAVVFAARTDEQRPLPKPIRPAFRRAMVDPVVRLFAAAREEGATRGVILGSYYTYFNRRYPQWKLAGEHAYVRCRLEQASEARAAAGPGLPVAVMELPFILGPGTNWAGPLAGWARSRTPLLAPPGGTAVASAQTVAELTADALERSSGADLPVADENLTWADMLARIAAAAGHPRAVHRLPAAAVRAATGLGGVLQSVSGKETGLNTGGLARLLLRDLFVEPATGRSLDSAFRETFGEASGISG